MISFRIVSLFILLFQALSPLVAIDWLPIDPAQQALNTPKIEKDADAEVLYWEFRVKDVFQGQDYWAAHDHYLRIKVFTDKGIKDYSSVELPSGPRLIVTGVSARTIKPDGTIVELKKDDIVEREQLRAGRRKYRARVINFPGVEKGSIVEYRYSETRMNELSTNLRIPFQREIPVHKLRVSVKPLQTEWMRYEMRSYSFNTKIPPMTRDNQGFASFTLEDRKSFRPEPFMTPEYQEREWMLIFYEEDKKLTPEKFWKETGKDVYRKFRLDLKTDGAMKQAAAEATQGATTEAEKGDAIFRWMRKNVRNVYSLGSGVSAEQRQEFKPNKTPSDTLKQKLGSGNDLMMLFSSLALSAGLEPRLALSSDRGFRFFDPSYMARAMTSTSNIAVKTATGWRMYDPAGDHLVPGMLSWREEGNRTLVTDPKEPQMIDGPLLSPEQSKATNKADLVIEEDGTVLAQVTQTYTGHQARARRLNIDEDTDAERIENVTEELKKRFGASEVTGLKIENVNEDDQPLIYRFTVKVPGYATRTGKRLFLQPGFFQFQQPARFPESKRVHPIFFNYSWQDIDEVTLNLPEGMTVEKPTAPNGFKLGSVGDYKAKLQMTADGKKLVYSRELLFGKEGSIGFPVTAYPTLKKVFDAVHEEDGHTLTLRAEN